LGFDFGSLWAPFWDSKSVSFACRPKTGSRAAQERPKSSQQQPKSGREMSQSG